MSQNLQSLVLPDALTRSLGPSTLHVYGGAKSYEMIDIGANLTAVPLSRRVDSLLHDSGVSGVKAMSVTASGLKSAREAIELVKKFGNNKHGIQLCTTAGTHPHEASQDLAMYGEAYIAELKHLICNNREWVRCVGECGLDYDRNFSTHDDQKKMFELQMDLALELAMPVFLHCRDNEADGTDYAYRDFSKLIGSEKYASVKKVIHCFTDPSLRHLEHYLKLPNTFIGITGWVCDERPNRGLGLSEIVRHIPLDRLMIETDCPYLTPRNIPGKLRKKLKVNEPSALGWIVKKLSEKMDKSEQEICQATTQNAKAFFGFQ